MSTIDRYSNQRRRSSPLAALFLSTAHLPFIGIIIANIEMIEYGNVEFIISDRHLLDHTLALLQQKYGNDKRFRFLSRVQTSSTGSSISI